MTFIRWRLFPAQNRGTIPSPTAHDRPQKTTFQAIALFMTLLAVLASACGAEGRRAPEVHSPRFEGAMCPSTEDALAQTQAAFERPELRAMRPHLAKILVREGGMRLAFPLFVASAREMAAQDLVTLIAGYEEGRGLAHLSGHVLDLVAHLADQVESNGEQGLAISESASRVLTRCDTVGTLRSVAKIAVLDIGDSGVRVSWLSEVVKSLAFLSNQERFQGWVSRLRFALEDKEANEVEGRGAVLQVAQLLAANIASPDFDASYLRGVLEDFLLAQENQPPELREELLHLIDLLWMVTEPELDILPAVQRVAGCVNQQDPDAAIAGLIFDVVMNAGIDVPLLASDLEALVAEEEGEAAYRVLLAVDRVLAQQENVARDFVTKFAEFLSPELYSLTVPALQTLVESGMMRELFDVIGRWMYGCSEGVK